MKEGMSNVDVAALAAELRPLLVGARLEKAYQPAKDQILLRLRRRGVGRMDLVFQLGRYLTVTRKPPENPDQPSMVAKIIRSDYGNGRVKDVRQLGFDRLLRMDVQRGDGDRAIVFELFGDGNMLLLDAHDVIALPMRGVEHGARRLKRGEPYQPPPGGAEPFAMDEAGFRSALAAAKRDVVRFLALDLGFGPLWAEELCLRAEVPKNTKVAAADDGQVAALYAAVQDVGKAIAADHIEPGLVYEDGALIDAVPQRMQKYPPPGFAVEEAASFREALDTFFRGTVDEDVDDDPRQARFDEARGKVERQVQQMQDAIAGFERDEAQRHADGEVLYLRFQQVQAILDGLQKARRDRSWQDIADTLAAARERGDEAAKHIVTLRPHDATAVLRLQDIDGEARDITIDIRRSVQQNAEAQYEAAKKARSRREGAAKALDDAKARLADIDAKGLDGFGAAPTRATTVSRHFWFEHYRWTVLPGGFLAVGGRNAGQNDAVVKKYLRDGDRYVHAEIHGAPSIVVRPADGGTAEPPEAVLALAGQFGVAASRAWRQFGAAGAYWVTPQQVSKTPRSGEFVPRGAWIVHGKRHVMEGLAMEWAVGVVRFTKGGEPVPVADAEGDEALVPKLAGGPPDALVPYAAETVRLVPGDIDLNDAAAHLAERFDVSMEEAQAALPGGPVAFEEGAP